MSLQLTEGGSRELKARMAEIVRLREEAEQRQKAEKARKAEAEKARAAEMARIKREAEDARKAEIARTAEIASLKQALEARLKAGGPGGKNALPDMSGVDFGRYHALVIGIEDYKHLPKLQTAVNDAVTVARVLKKEYGFKVTLLLDPDHGEVIDAFNEYREKLGPTDNLLIYYVGHGWLDEDSVRGYWLPVDAGGDHVGRAGTGGRQGRWP